MYCSNCGEQAKNGDNFCRKCGTKLSLNKVKDDSEKHINSAHAINKNNLQEKKDGFYYYQESTNRKERKKLSRKIKILGISLALITILITGIISSISTPEKTVKEFINYLSNGKYTECIKCMDTQQIFEAVTNSNISYDEYSSKLSNAYKEEFSNTKIAITSLNKSMEEEDKCIIRANVTIICNNQKEDTQYEFTLVKRKNKWYINDLE